jgi:hypothetical protein
VPKLLGIIGLLVICAGIDLLWQSRHEIKFWIVAYIASFRALLHNRDSAPPVFPSKEAARKRRGTVRFLLGVSFAFLLGPLLIAIGIALIFFPHL